MNWFKFYGQDFITDPKIKQLSTAQQLAWVYLLCLASQNDGKIKYLTEYVLAGMIGLQPTDDEWGSLEGVFKIFEELEMITIDNDDNKMITILRYHSRQESNLSSYERVKKHRLKVKNEAKNDNKRNVINDNTRIDKNRIDKNINKKEIIIKKKDIDSLNNEDLQEIASKYKVPLSMVILSKEKMDNWLLAKGKRYKDYKAGLRNWVLRDAEAFFKKPNANKQNIDAREL